MNIFLLEFKKRIYSTLIWIASLAFFSWVCFFMFEGMVDGAILAMMEQFPDAFLKAFGMDTDMSSILGYFGMVGAFFALCAAIFACNIGLNAVSVEERDLTADFLISKPVSRSRILTAKLLASVLHIVLFTLITGLVNLLFIEIYKAGQDYSVKAFWMVTLGFLLIGLLFFSLGLLLSLLLKKLESPLPFSLGISFGFYILDTFDAILEETFLKYLIPFDYFEIKYITENIQFKGYGLIITVLLILAGVSGSYVLYRKRNIPTAM